MRGGLEFHVHGEVLGVQFHDVLAIRREVRHHGVTALADLGTVVAIDARALGIRGLDDADGVAQFRGKGDAACMGDANRTITLPTIQARALNNADSAGALNFDLSANCSNATSVTFRFTGTPASGNNQLFANTGSAQGVALWLYSRTSGTTQTIAHNGSRTVAVSGNRAVLPLGAAYHRNGTVRQGTLASTTTVNITYN